MFDPNDRCDSAPEDSERRRESSSSCQAEGNPGNPPHSPNSEPPGRYEGYSHQPPASQWPEQPPQGYYDRDPYPPYPYQPRSPHPGDYNPYQYNPNSGWQQGGYTPPPPPPPRYEWNMNDYQRYDKKSGDPGTRRRYGFLIFALCLVASLSIGLVAITAMGLLGPQSDLLPADIPAESVPVEAAEVLPSSEGVSIALELSSKPQVSEALPVGGRMTIPQVAEYVSPSVVSVIKYQENQIYSEAAGIGSGIVLSWDGYIVTNAHVVEGGSSFKVQLQDGTPYDARLVGADSYTDLAVLKVEAEDLHPALFGDSEELLVGETVVAIGNPVDLSFAGSVTRGIVSAVGRQVSTSRYAMPYIQTDAAINPGNSGGALANEFGQVIGINTAKISRTGYEGMGFAIPISDAKPIIDDLLMYGWVTGRVKLGIEGLPIDAVDAARANLVEGVIVKVIDPSSDLHNKGVIKDDVITHVNGDRVYTTTDIHAAIDGFKVGDEIQLSIYRRLSPTSDTTFDVTVKLIESRD